MTKYIIGEIFSSRGATLYKNPLWLNCVGWEIFYKLWLLIIIINTFKISEVTIIPTYDSDVLGYWVADNEDALTEYKIDLAPSASRCTINLQDHETSCAAYRLEF